MSLQNITLIFTLFLSCDHRTQHSDTLKHLHSEIERLKLENKGNVTVLHYVCDLDVFV